MKLEEKIEKIQYFLENVDEKEVDYEEVKEIKSLLRFILFYADKKRKMAHYRADKALDLIGGWFNVF